MKNLDCICYTDGGCNPVSGSWAVIISGRDGVRRELSGYQYAPVTVNHMELWAIYMAISNTPEWSRIRVVSDSQYAVNCCSVWHIGWARKGWVTKDKKAVKNAKLIRKILELVKVRQVAFAWVRGHNGHPENERADKLCSEESKLARLMLTL